MVKATKALLRLAAAAEAWGDNRNNREKELRAWKRGDPPLRPDPEGAKAHQELESAARAYATSTRAQRRKDGADG